jgi:hypothetical protein
MMKNFILSLLALFYCLSVSAQDLHYAPFIHNHTYQYLNSNKDTVHSLRVVSTIVQEGKKPLSLILFLTIIITV